MESATTTPPYNPALYYPGVYNPGSFYPASYYGSNYHPGSFSYLFYQGPTTPTQTNKTHTSDDVEDDTPFQETDPIDRLFHLVGLFVALAVGAIAIVGVAFVISRLRRRGNSTDEQDATSVENGERKDSLADIPQFDIKHIYTISGCESDKTRNPVRKVLYKLRCSRKQTTTDLHEAVRRDLGRIYVY